jgi:MFS family permease
MAVGSITGALLSARRPRPRIELLLAGAFTFGLGCTFAALAPSYALFGVSLALIGISAQTFSTTANGTLQLGTEPAMRGRVMAIFVAVALGGTPLGAPIVGFVADRMGPRFALGVGALAGFAATLVGLRYLNRLPSRSPPPIPPAAT